jgi:UDP-N-acetylglucosamine--N-acetylmuramyl-(pentapeptide) pyrophosphoryl-undecaprenol N-acetylglucosamine transferase
LNKKVKIIVAGGGTGGHIFPAIAIANAIKELIPTATFLFVGANGKMEMEKVPQAGFEIVGLDIAGFNRSSLLKNIGLPFKLVKSFLQVKKIISGFKPNAVIGVGGYSTFPVLRYAQAKGIPTFIHESNSFAGKANILLGKKATKVFVATTGMEKFFAAEKIMITGNPVRSAIENDKKTKEEGTVFFKMDATKLTVLSIGGSLGAKSINEAIAEHIALFKENDVQLIWQTGNPFFEAAKKISDNYKNVYTSAFIKEMDYAYAAADVIISRAGAMAIAEICTLAKPSILVPYPFAAEDHQTVNATHLVEKNAAVMIRDEMAKTTLVSTVLELLKQKEQRELFSKNVQALVGKDVDIVIAKEIIKNIV